MPGSGNKGNGNAGEKPRGSRGGNFQMMILTNSCQSRSRISLGRLIMTGTAEKAVRESSGRVRFAFIVAHAAMIQRLPGQTSARYDHIN